MSHPRSPPSRSKRPCSQGDAQEPAPKRARTAGAFGGSSSISPTDDIPPHRRGGHGQDTDGSSNVTAIELESSDESPLNSLGPFPGRLPRELRDAIYEHLLDHNKAPLARTSDDVTQPTWVRFSSRMGAFVGREIDHIEPQVADTNNLMVNKVIQSEPLEAMYRVNTISLSVQQSKQLLTKSDIVQQGLFSTVASARHILLRMGWSGVDTVDRTWYRSHETIDLDSFFNNIQAALPWIRSVTVRTDHALSPATALFDIGVNLMNCDKVTNVRFDAVESLVAETEFGFTVRVEHRRITKRWQYQMTRPLMGDQPDFRSITAQRCWTKRLLEAVEQGEVLDTCWQGVLAEQKRIFDQDWQAFSKGMIEVYKT
jgi:hypothetical protein